MAKKKKEPEPPPPPEPEPVVEEEEKPKEEVQYTDTSYTSASFESLPPLPEVPKKKKGKKAHDVHEGKVEHVVREESAWSFEDEPVVEEPKVEEEQVKKKKKGKKEKKKKEKEVEEIPEFKKPKGYRDMTPKQRKDWLEQMIIDWREQKEAERIAFLQGAADRLAAGIKMRADLVIKDMEEQNVRNRLLKSICELFDGAERYRIEKDNAKEKLAEWHTYLKCDGLPDPRVVTEVNTYLHVWQLMDRALCDEEELNKRLVEVLPMLTLLDQFVDRPKHYHPRLLQNYKDIRVFLREELSQGIEWATYFLLRDIENNLTSVDVHLSTYGREFKCLKLNLWVTIRMPTKRPNPLDPPAEPVDLEFPALQVKVRIPTEVDSRALSVRAAKSDIDFFSERARTFKLKEELPDTDMNLCEFMSKEYDAVCKLKAEQDTIRKIWTKDKKAKIKELEHIIDQNKFLPMKNERAELEQVQNSEPPELPNPRTWIGEQRDLAFANFLTKTNVKVRGGEVNLRKYRISGGVLHLDLIDQPPQPKQMDYDIELVTLPLPKQIRLTAYQILYRTPPPPPPGVIRTPMEIEEQMKVIEKEYQKLALVNIDLPKTVYWFEQPIVCQWYSKRNIWTNDFINDYKYNEDKFTVAFRTGVMWPIGFATLKYSNFPLQGWEVKPDTSSKGVFITAIGLYVTVTWRCKGSLVSLVSVRHAAVDALMRIRNKKFSVARMVQIMKEASCDFFPQFDSHNYIEGSCRKEWAIEQHQYHAMGFLSRAYNFQWSRWNAQAGFRAIVMQMREAVDLKRQAAFQLLRVDPEHATLIKCQETSPEYSDEPYVGMKFYPDLYSLNLHYGSVDARRTVIDMDHKLAETVYAMLSELKLCSFS